MALLEVLKWNTSNDEDLVWKFPSEEIPLGSQLIVSSTQQCIFRRNGKNVDSFSAGNHTLTSANLPILNKIVNLPFGGKAPFSAEVWFVSKTTKRNMKWGTSAPIQIIEPKFNVPVNVRAFGQWGIQIEDSQLFLEELVGTRKYSSSKQVYEYFRGELIQSISQAISQRITEGNVSFFNLNSMLSQIVENAVVTFSKILARYGISLTNLSIDRINIPDEELKSLQEIMLKRAAVQQLSDVTVTESYKAIRGLEVLEAAAKNEGGSIAPVMAQAGLGAAIGIQTGNAVMNTINSANQREEVMKRLKDLKELLDMGILNNEEFAAKKAELLAKL